MTLEVHANRYLDAAPDRSSNKLRDYLRARFVSQRTVAQLAKATTSVCNGMTAGDTLLALTRNLAAAVKASAPPSQWAEVATVIGEELRRSVAQ